MLHELLFSLLGFVGDIVVNDGATFRVKDGFDLLKESEKVLVNRIAPLGWFYVKLGDIVHRYDVSWGTQRTPKAYMSAAVQGVSDLLSEYVSDVAYLEQLILTDGPIPLNQVQQHLQKYQLVFPELYTMLLNIEKEHIQGCRLLDYFYNYNTGVPVVKEVIDRIVLRLRVVFVKQCFAWMIHGELEDPGLEFFVQSRVISGTSQSPSSHTASALDELTLQDSALNALFQAKKVTQEMLGGSKNSSFSIKNNKSSPRSMGQGGNFDWTASYNLSLDKIPGSHVSPRLASKIVFAGKAVKLLQSSGALNALNRSSNAADGRGVSDGFNQSDAYRYLSSGAAVLDAEAGGEQRQELREREKQVNSIDNYETEEENSNNNNKLKESVNESVRKQTRQAFQRYVGSGGYSECDIERFTSLFTSVLDNPDQAVELVETAVEAVNDCISNQLWVLLRDMYGFSAFLQVIRNTYLLGRGELFQGLLDGILQLTHSPPPETLEMDNLLNWKVLRTSAKLVGLENDDSLNELLVLRVQCSDLTIRNFALHSQDLQLLGAAQEVSQNSVMGGDGDRDAANGDPVRIGQKTAVDLCRPYGVSSQQLFDQIWLKFIRKSAVGCNTLGVLQSAGEGSPVDSLDAPTDNVRTASPADDGDNDNDGGLLYSTGAVWVTGQKAVSKGFDWSATFSCAWTDLRAHLTNRHAAFQAGKHTQSVESNGFSSSGRISAFPPPSTIDACVLPLGSICCHLRGDRKTFNQPVATHHAVLSPAGPGALSVGVIFYAMTVPNTATVYYYARLFLRTGSGGGISGGSGVAGQGQGFSVGVDLHRQRHAHISVGATGHSIAHSAMDYIDNDLVFGDGVIDIDGGLAELGLGAHIQGTISSSSTFRLDVEYARSQRNDANTTSNDASTVFSSSPSVYGAHSAAGVVYTIRARLVDASAPVSHNNARFSHLRSVSAHRSLSDRWHLEAPMNITNHVKCQGGQAFVGLDAVGLLLSVTPTSPSAAAAAAATAASDSSHYIDGASPFYVRVWQQHFSGRGTLSTYPVTSASTAARHPETASRVQEEVDRVRAWMNLRLQLTFPSMFRVIFDAEAVNGYERVFAVIMKVRVVAHALERLWIARSRLASDRSFCQSRHSMHFFVSNLLYYLQVDVVDSEFSTLRKDISEAADFQSVLRAHKNFTSNMLRLSLIDNLSVQEGIDRILHICLRFIAICRILHRSEFLDVDDVEEMEIVSQHTTPMKAQGILSDADRISILHAPIYVPPEELDFIRSDFFAQVSLLFQVMRKVESRGFIFRLDFNNFLSNAARDYGAL